MLVERLVLGHEVQTTRAWLGEKDIHFCCPGVCKCFLYIKWGVGGVSYLKEFTLVIGKGGGRR